MDDNRICSTCGSTMGIGAPLSEEIRVQYECWCGNIETETFDAAVGKTGERELENEFIR